MLTSVLAAGQPVAPPSYPPQVVRVEGFGHTVADLDKTLAFYRDVFGLEVETPPGKPVANAALQKLTNTPGGKYRTAHLKIPNETFTLDLIEITGVERKLRMGGHEDPGVPFLNLSVKDGGVAFEALRKINPVLLTKSGIPINLPAGSLATVFVRDPDGFILEVIQRGEGNWFTVPPPAVTDGPGQVLHGQIDLTMDNEDQIMWFYHDVLGFDIRPGYMRSLEQIASTPVKIRVDAGWDPTKRLADVISVPGDAQMRLVTGNCATVRCEFFEFKDRPLKPFRPRIQDPGAGILSVRVRDLNLLLKELKSAGLEVVSTEGMTSQIRNTKQVIIKDPSGLYVELKQ